MHARPPVRTAPVRTAPVRIAPAGGLPAASSSSQQQQQPGGHHAGLGGGGARGGGAPAAEDGTATHPTLGGATPTPGVREGDRVVHNGTAFNGRGYRVCGVVNQRGTLCGRIGTCPYHHQQQQQQRQQQQQPDDPSLLLASSTAGAAVANTSDTENQQHRDDEMQNHLRGGGKDRGKLTDNAQTTTTDTATTKDDAEIHAGSLKATGAAAKRAAARAHAQALVLKSVLHLDAAPTKAGFKRSWSREEHVRFLLALRRHGRGKWKEIAREIGTRTANQCQSHAQKHFLRQAKDASKRVKPSIHDITDVDDADLLEKLAPNAAAAAGKSQPKGHVGRAALVRVDTALAGPTSRISGDGTTSAIADSLAREVTSPRLISQQDPLAVLGRPLVDRCRFAQDSKVHQTLHDTPNRPLREDAELLLENCTQRDRPSQHVAERSPADVAPVLLGQESVFSAPGISDSDRRWSNMDVIVAGMHGQGSDQNPQVIQPDTGVLSDRRANFGDQEIMSAASAAPVHLPPAFPVLQISVRIHLNGTSVTEGKAITIPESVETEEFLTLAAAELGVAPVFARMFTRSGAEISSLDEVIEGEALWLSDGAEFKYPTL